MKRSITLIILSVGIIFLAGRGQEQVGKNQPKKKVAREQQNFDIMNFMEEARIYATFCDDKKTDIASANGGEKFCDEGASYSSINRLRQMSFCGDKPEDTRWLVTNG